MPWVVECTREPYIDHEKGCGYLSNHPIEGDEGATCTCGVYEDNGVVWLGRTRKACLTLDDAREHARDAYQVDLNAAAVRMLTSDSRGPRGDGLKLRTRDGRDVRFKRVTYAGMCAEMGMSPNEYKGSTFAACINIQHDYNARFWRPQ